MKRVKSEGNDSEYQSNWISRIEHYRDLLLKVVEQTKRRIFDHEKVPPPEKIVSLFGE
ncbi:MAG: hypothetical protein P8179_12475 [Candidatus Thiodiazotropha sp.]